uniref:Microtubule-associated protein n=1 Tax=Globodera rostochiensis TaxID=31243 RepID=A0A914I9M0_GLORO
MSDEDGGTTPAVRLKTLRQRRAEGAEELSRFRPPITPSNSLLIRSPPVIMITSHTGGCSSTRQVLSNGNGNSSSSASSSAGGSGTTRVNHPPQPFPAPLQRRRSSCSSSAGSPLGSAGFHPRYSAPRLSITSLGSVAKSFRNIAAFIVPEEEGKRERARDRLRRKVMLRGRRAVTETARKNSGRVFEFFPGLKKTDMEPISKMRSSAAAGPRPLLRSSTSQQKQQQLNALPKNGAPTARGRESGSRSRSDASGQKLNGQSPRAPSVPVNRRYAHVKSKVGSMTDYSPPPSNSALCKTRRICRIENRKLNFREAAKPRVEDKSAVPVPKSDKKLEWKAQSKVGSLENAKHKPSGGNLKIFNEPVRVKSESKIGSLDNIGHVSGGGNIKISDYARSISGSGGSRRDTADSGRSSSSADAGTPKPTTDIGLSPQQSPRPVEMVLTPKEVPSMSPTDDQRHDQRTNGTHIAEGERNGVVTEEAEEEEPTPREQHNNASVAPLINLED